MDSDTFDDNPLSPSESLDSDEVRNDDGDEVADPPERWIEARDDESLDERLAEEVPDVAPENDSDGGDGDGATEAHDSDEGGGLELVSDDEMDRIDPDQRGTEAGQIDGTPEDGGSFFSIEK